MSTAAYAVCRTVNDARSALALAGGRMRILAGGTDLLLEFRHPGASPHPPVLDISRIDSLRGIETAGGMVRIGALTTHAAIAASETLLAAAPLLSGASAAIGSPQIRNRGTVGGNIMNAAACADTVPPLLALGARLTLVSSRGTRELPIDGFFTEPYRTVAAADELLTQIAFSPLPPDARSAFLKLGRRNAVSIARLSVAAVLARDRDGLITDARIVPGAAMPVWIRCREAEAILLGRKPSPALLQAAGEKTSGMMIAQTGRRWSTEYKEPVLAVLVTRALEACCPEFHHGTQA